MTNKHAPVETQWTDFVEYLRKHGVDIEEVEAKMKAYTRKRARRLAAAYRQRHHTEG
jgi:hypothetical protein